MRTHLYKVIIFTAVAVLVILNPVSNPLRAEQTYDDRINYSLTKLITSPVKPDSLVQYYQIVFDLPEKPVAVNNPDYSPDPDVILQGGDDCSSATVIQSLPFVDVGTTVGYTNDYDAECPYDALAPDVVYSFAPDSSGLIEISLCTDSTDYDTKLYVYEDLCQYPYYACDDDECTSTNFPNYPYVSKIRNLAIYNGHTYYIVIDGYGNEAGTYELYMTWVISQTIECPHEGIPEGEPDCHDEYEDQYNSGCGGMPPVFSYVNPGEVICGTSGTFLYQSSNYRDTDWYEYSPSYTEQLTWKAVAEFPLFIAIIYGTQGCYYMELLDYTLVDEYDTAVVSLLLEPGTYWMWITPQVFEGAPCPAEYVAWFDAEPALLPYLPGDANMYNSIWPPQVIGSDVTYLVNYFRGIGEACEIDGFWASADANGDCNIIGSDITRLVEYFRGNTTITFCPDYEPSWLTPDDLPDTAPDGWPNCDP